MAPISIHSSHSLHKDLSRMLSCWLISVRGSGYANGNQQIGSRPSEKAVQHVKENLYHLHPRISEVNVPLMFNALLWIQPCTRWCCKASVSCRPGNAAFPLLVKHSDTLTFRRYGKTWTWLHGEIGPLFHLFLCQIFLMELPFWVWNKF